MAIYIYTGLPGAGKSTDLETFDGRVFKFTRRYGIEIAKSVLQEKAFLEDLVDMKNAGKLPNHVAFDRFVIDEAVFAMTFNRKHQQFIWDYIVHSFQRPSVLDNVYVVHFSTIDYDEIVARLHDRHANECDAIWTAEMLEKVDARYMRLYGMLNLKKEVTVIK